MARKELLPLIADLRRWRHAHGFSQYEAARVLRDAGIPVTTDSLQAWEIGRWNPRRTSPWPWPSSSKSSPSADAANDSRIEVNDRFALQAFLSAAIKGVN